MQSLSVSVDQFKRNLRFRKVSYAFIVTDGVGKCQFLYRKICDMRGFAFAWTSGMVKLS